MSASSESKVTQKFRENVDRGTLSADMKIIYRIAGGIPSERFEEEFIISGNGKTDVKSLDMLTPRPKEAATLNLNNEETREAFQKIRLSLESMVPLEKASFLPDSLVGSVTLEINGEKTTLYFPVEEAKEDKDRKLTSSPISDTIQYFSETSKKLLKKEKGGNL